MPLARDLPSVSSEYNTHSGERSRPVSIFTESPAVSTNCRDSCFICLSYCLSMRSATSESVPEVPMTSKKVHREKPEDAFDDLNLDRNALPKDPRIDEIVNEHMHELGSHLTNPEDRDRVPGVAVAVRTDKKLVHLNCHGYANLETGAKITPDTVFDLGSLSKEFTAFGILGMVDNEEIDKKDCISKFFSEFPRY